MYGQDAWRSLEKLIYRDLARPDYRDDVRPVVEEIDKYLKSDAVVGLLRQMGLLSVGYLFDAPWARTFQFFRGGDDEHYITPYLWLHQETLGSFSALIHALFLQIRKRQQNQLEQLEYHTEEFYLCLPYISSPASSPVRAYYCPVGKMLFWLYTWRLLWYFEHLAGPAEPFEPGRVVLSQRLEQPATFSWCDEVVVEPEFGTAVDRLDLSNWEAEYRVLCLYCTAARRCTPWVRAIDAYLNAGLGKRSLTEHDLATLDASLQQASADWMASVVPQQERQFCKTARLWIEAHAPAPLLPYYFWIGLDGWPKTYLVCPIWASPFYPAKIPGGITPIAGLALCGVAPLRQWETWDDNLKLPRRGNLWVTASVSEPSR